MELEVVLQAEDYELFSYCGIFWMANWSHNWVRFSLLTWVRFKRQQAKPRRSTETASWAGDNRQSAHRWHWQSHWLGSGGGNVRSQKCSSVGRVIDPITARRRRSRLSLSNIRRFFMFRLSLVTSWIPDCYHNCCANFCDTYPRSPNTLPKRCWRSLGAGLRLSVLPGVRTTPVQFPLLIDNQM